MITRLFASYTLLNTTAIDREFVPEIVRFGGRSQKKAPQKTKHEESRQSAPTKKGDRNRRS